MKGPNEKGQEEDEKGKAEEKKIEQRPALESFLRHDPLLRMRSHRSFFSGFSHAGIVHAPHIHVVLIDRLVHVHILELIRMQIPSYMQKS